jgi:hypothetical protein
MDFDSMTFRELKELMRILGNNSQQDIQHGVGQSVIIRTYSAGVWFGTLSQKSGNEVVLTSARRMFRWQAQKEITLSAVALYGIDHKKSQIVAPVPSVWLEAIEIIPCTDVAAISLAGAPHVQAQ